MFDYWRKKSPEEEYKRKYESFIKEISDFCTWDNFDEVKSLVQETLIRTISTRTNPQIGESKTGGCPDLPQNITWPTYENKPMVFLAQVNLSEIVDWHKNEYLPKTGMLYFFSYFPDPINEYGAEFSFLRPKEKTQVLYYNGELTNLNATTFPDNLHEAYQLTPESLEFELIFFLPRSLYTAIMENSKLSERDKNLVQEYNDQFSDGFLEQMLGTPLPIQSGADFDQAIMYLNIDFDELEERMEELNPVREKLVNLLSIHIPDAIGDCEGYFGIHIDDLQNHEFEKTVFIMQGT